MQKIYSLALPGHEGIPIQVECRVSRGLPALLIVGSANRSVTEAKERIRSALAASDLRLPPQRITINLLPGDIPKSGTGFDLAIAASILATLNPQLRLLPRSMIFGELGLDGTIHPVRGLIGTILAARARGFATFYIPASQYQQAALIPNINLVPVQSLREFNTGLAQPGLLIQRPTGLGTVPQILTTHGSAGDFSHVAGQLRAKRALEIAAAGGHNILLSGPPGTGKSLLAQALPSIMPPLQSEEVLEVTHLHSLASQDYSRLILERPFRSPHHTASSQAIIGSSQPGEISLAHRGILFLDEVPEFSRSTLEALRQPLEEKVIAITQAHARFVFPADFILVATTNPCPCGYYGTTKPCRCPAYSVTRYQQKLSGPIIDRIDLYIDVEPVAHKQLMTSVKSESSTVIRERVMRARERQYARTSNALNALLDNETLRASGQLAHEAKQLLDTAAGRLKLSARAYMRTIKVARTIADLADSPSIKAAHIGEALQYRRTENP